MATMEIIKTARTAPEIVWPAPEPVAAAPVDGVVLAAEVTLLGGVADFVVDGEVEAETDGENVENEDGEAEEKGRSDEGVGVDKAKLSNEGVVTGDGREEASSPLGEVRVGV